MAARPVKLSDKLAQFSVDYADKMKKEIVALDGFPLCPVCLRTIYFDAPAVITVSGSRSQTREGWWIITLIHKECNDNHVHIVGIDCL